MNVISGAARAARNAVGVLRDAGEGAWSFTSSKLRRRTQTSEEARAGLEVEPQLTTEPESEPITSEAPTAKKAAAKASAKKAAAKVPATKAGVAKPARSETAPA